MKRPKLIAAGLVEHRGKYLLVKEIVEGNQEFWLIPGGSVEFGEYLADAVKRELKEEVGLDVKVERFLAFKEANFPNFDYHTVIFFYLVKVHQAKKMVTEGKILAAEFFTLDEIEKLKLIDSAQWLFDNLNNFN